MMLKKNKFLLVIISMITFINILSIRTFNVFADIDKIYLGGYPAGFSLQTNGVLVVSLCDVLTENGIKSPAKEADIEINDRIISINDHQVNSANDISNLIKNKDLVFLKISRYGEIIEKNINPVADTSGEYKLGVFVKDEICGIGTITYIKNNRFASLGHPVMDENGIVDIRGGNIYNCSIVGCIKGERGKPGELKGVFLKNASKATINKNLENGVYGQIDDINTLCNLREIELGNAKVGDATIFSTISGAQPKEYKITIIKLDKNQSNKNFVIKITDEELLKQTGGIVQGMSGSPIVQEGKLVGAVTHVFINDPTRGFGINIYNMINN